MKKVAIGDLRPNPFRRLDEYPIQREKVEALKNSIEHTGFWKTIVGRPADGGCVEVAFGHHRLVALQELFGPDESVEIVVQDFSNESMLQMMANENMAEWGSDGWVEVETIRATIDAADRGLIKLPEVGDRGPRQKTAQNSVQFCRATIARFLGWTRRAQGARIQPDFKCEVAFDAIEAMDDDLINPADLRGLPRYKIRELVLGARSVRKAELDVAEQNRRDAERARELAESAETAAEQRRLERRAELHEHQAAQHRAVAESKTKQFVEQAAAIAHSGKGKHEEIRELARSMAPPTQRTKKVPDVSGLADQLAKKLANVLNGDDGLSSQLALLAEFRGELAKGSARELVRAATLLRLRLEEKIVKVFDVD